MKKYCNVCERNLENDKFCSFRKSIWEDCSYEKVKCDICDKEFNTTNLSKHIKQVHASTYNINYSRRNDSTYISSRKMIVLPLGLGKTIVRN